jgi:hypothetical protein
LKAMTLEEYNLLEQELINSGLDNKSFLTSRGIKLHKYYYWKRKSRDLKEDPLQTEGQFLPIDVHSGGLIKPGKRGKGIKQPFITHGEIEIELRTPSGAELRIRGIMDSLMVSTIIASTGGRRNV